MSKPVSNVIIRARVVLMGLPAWRATVALCGSIRLVLTVYVTKDILMMERLNASRVITHVRNVRGLQPRVRPVRWLEHMILWTTSVHVALDCLILGYRHAQTVFTVVKNAPMGFNAQLAQQLVPSNPPVSNAYATVAYTTFQTKPNAQHATLSALHAVTTVSVWPAILQQT